MERVVCANRGSQARSYSLSYSHDFWDSQVVEFGGSAYVPLAVPQTLEAELAKLAARAREIQDPFEQSLFLMAFVSYLQAFQDVNKRTGRLSCSRPSIGVYACGSIAPVLRRLFCC